VPATTRSERSPAGPLLGLLLVPGPSPVAALIPIADSARAISDTLGGHLVDDTLVAALDDGTAVTFYRTDLTGATVVPALPDNPAAAVLAARLGLTDWQDQTRLRGPILVLGLDGARDISVPQSLLTAARQAGLDIIALAEPGPGQ
jgi:hypothetical protein